MEFPCLSDDDLGNVRALNRLFLDWQRTMPRSATASGPPAVALHELIAALHERQLERLASTPFLLLSLRERDGDCWDDIFDAEPSGQLFEPDPAPGDTATQLLATSLSFLWHLARRSAYAARVVSGAGLAWCERLGDCTLVSLLSRAAKRTDLLVPRFSDNAEVWKKLLSAGVSAEPAVRSAAQLSAMQTMLTQSAPAPPDRFRAAACRMPSPRAR